MKSFTEYVAEMNLSKEKPALEIIDKRQRPASGKGSLPQPQQVAPGKRSLPTIPKPSIPKLKPKF